MEISGFLSAISQRAVSQPTQKLVGTFRISVCDLPTCGLNAEDGGNFQDFWRRSSNPNTEDGGNFQDFCLRSPNARSPKAENGGNSRDFWLHLPIPTQRMVGTFRTSGCDLPTSNLPTRGLPMQTVWIGPLVILSHCTLELD